MFLVGLGLDLGSLVLDLSRLYGNMLFYVASDSWICCFECFICGSVVYCWYVVDLQYFCSLSWELSLSVLFVAIHLCDGVRFSLWLKGAWYCDSYWLQVRGLVWIVCCCGLPPLWVVLVRPYHPCCGRRFCHSILLSQFFSILSVRLETPSPILCTPRRVCRSSDL